VALDQVVQVVGIEHDSASDAYTRDSALGSQPAYVPLAESRVGTGHSDGE
jgi:hypothetical protein